MPAISMLVLCSIAILSSVVQVTWKRNHPSIPRIAHININGEPTEFMTNEVASPSQSHAHYDLAIDFCSRNGADLGFEVENIHHCILPLMQALQQDLKPMKQMTTHPFGKGMHLKQCQIYFQLRDWIRRSKAISYLQRRVSFRFSNSAGQNADNNHATVKNLKLQHPKRNVEREVVKFNGIGELSKYVNEQTMDATYELNTANNNAALPTKTVANDTENKVDKIPIANADLTETGNASGEIETMNGNQRTDAKEFPLSLFINNQQYVFYLPVPDSSSSGITNSEHIQTAIQRLAEEFCRVHGINLLSGFLQENADQFQDPSLLSSLMTERCIHPVGQALLQELQQSVVVE